MIRDLAAALAFLTRIPTGRRFTFESYDVMRASRYFPLVGALLGCIYAGVLWILIQVLPWVIVAILLVGLDAWITGALHFDGLADTADGFGGGATSDDVLRIMRDHAIGSYGAVSLVLVIALKIATIGLLIGTARAAECLIVAPILGRWSAVVIGAMLPYARSLDTDRRPRFGRTEVSIATVISIGVCAAIDYRWGLAACLLVALGSIWWAWRCHRRIGGATGDTLGAAVEMSECLVLLLFVALR